MLKLLIRFFSRFSLVMTVITSGPIVLFGWLILVVLEASVRDFPIFYNFLKDIWMERRR